MEEVNLESIVNKIKKDFGGVSVANNVEDPKDYISTGNKVVDLMLEGGLAFGYICEWAGLSQSGKTHMLQKMLANAQQKYNAIGIWADRENAFTNERAEQVGIDTSKLIVVKPWDIPTVKDFSNFLSSTIVSIREKYPETYIFCAVDSISSFAGTQTGEDMGRKAKQLHEFFRNIIPLIDGKISLHLANQITFTPGIMFGNPQTTTGGEAPRYYSTYRIFLTTKKPILDTNNEDVGNWIDFNVVKTRRGPSRRSAVVPFLFKEGITELSGYIRMLADRGYVKPKNKSEFGSFKQKTVLYKDNSYTEDNPEKLLTDAPELLFEVWPEFNLE